MNRVFSTTKGTELPLLNLKGKDYLEVKYRLVWFREEHPTWSIETEFVSITDKSACARAVIRDDTGRIIATSHKAETANHFPDFLEKAETGSIGRALALIGYGTQFCADELDEGDRIVDAPAYATRSNNHERGQSFRPASQYVPPGRDQDENSAPEIVSASSAGLTIGKHDLGEFRITFGKKYMGKRLKDVAQDEIEGYVKWLENAAAKKNQGLTPEVALLKNAVDRFYHPEKFGGSSAEEFNGEESLQA